LGAPHDGPEGDDSATWAATSNESVAVAVVNCEKKDFMVTSRKSEMTVEVCNECNGKWDTEKNEWKTPGLKEG
jgi:hypothetical protein